MTGLPRHVVPGSAAIPLALPGDVTVLLVRWAHVQQAPEASFVAGSFGLLLMGLFHAWHGAFGRK
ncbi:hypothetical protein [Vitiosangium sp. GDMCC 1.1324]|uniref:hypothetical protein n=1 Tax=Vitiosangium sp. (strain GDMCC 1.1324) TaxID=2138576 RepID=UPI000D376FAE|nr:hypothetical protein [Vitiosangium sp. GDMCC 1.1324]PTL79750.1 hypothetical protein DAT35_33675 [Vitiosangium sp. GDMCC 1.1324]